MPLVGSKLRYIIPISGKDSLCTAIVQAAREPDLPYEYLFCDVGMELPETLFWLKKVEGLLGIKLNRVGKGLEEVMAEEGLLPSHTKRFCTRKGKIHPLQDFVGIDRAIQYLGIRADEDRVGSISLPPNIKLSYPLVDLGITLPMVYKILGDRGLIPPDFFWERLHGEVYNSLERIHQRFIDSLEPWNRSYFFSWRSRSNCYMCFYQRLYEWVGLLEHYPKLFSHAEELEKEYGSAGAPGMDLRLRYRDRVEDFYWRPEGPLSSVRRDAEHIFKGRVKKVRRLIIRAHSGVLSGDSEEVDGLKLVSCGMYCGK